MRLGLGLRIGSKIRYLVNAVVGFLFTDSGDKLITDAGDYIIYVD